MIKKVKKNRQDKIIERREELAKKEKVAAIWTRVSSKDQYDNNCSIESQIERCRDYCVRNGIRIKKEFGGKNESAADAGEMFMDMIGEVLNDPEYNQIIVSEFDRFSRCSNDGIIYKTKVKRCGISVISVSQPIDPNNVLAEQIENILIIIADIDNAIRKHKCHQGMVKCINKGEWYSRPPLGYDSKKEGTHHVITINEQGKILRNAFEWLANEPGISQFEILRRLKLMGLSINKQKLSSSLRNNFYCGRLEHKFVKLDDSGKNYIMGVQEPLISEALFERVQDILDGNHANYEHQEETPKFPMKRFVFCAKDGHLMTGYTTKNNDYYKCAVKGCKTNVRASELHGKYAELLNSFILPESVLPIFKKVLEKKFYEKEAASVEVIANIKKNLATLNTKLKTIKMRYAVGEIEKDVYVEASRELTLNIHKAEKVLEESETTFSNLSKFIEQSVSISSQLGYYWLKQDFQLCQKIQKLTFPEGINWDGEKKAFRTDNCNEYLAKIALLRTSVAGLWQKERDKSCDLSLLVAEGGLEPPTSGL